VNLADHFHRPNSTRVGDGWKDIKGFFNLDAEKLRCVGPGMVQATAARIVRGAELLNTQQRITIPALMWEPNKYLSMSPATIQGSWGLLSRIQPSGKAFGAYVTWYQNHNGNMRAPVQTGNGSMTLNLGICDADGSFHELAFGATGAPALPPRPGHAYSMTLTTVRRSSTWTYLRATLWDETTHLPMCNLSTVCDEPGLQMAGDVGIVGGSPNCVFSSYQLGRGANVPLLFPGGVIPGQ
jgi:hypothetical protein